MIPSTRVKGATAASGSKPKRNTKKDRTFPAKSDKQKVEDHPRINKSMEAHWKEIHFRRTVPIRFTKSKVVPVRQPETGSTSDIGIPERLRNTSHKPLTRYQRKNKQEKTTSTGIPTIAETQTTDSSVIYNVVSTNQHDPNKN
ncbi:hypothetical protein Tco_0037125 [Tanacetum coccineum]